MPRRPRGVRAAVAVLVLLGAAAWAPPALAGSASADGQVLRYSADPGESNALAIGAADDPDSGAAAYAVSDLGAPVTAGAACSGTDDGALCEAPAQRLEVTLSDGDDSLSLDAGLGLPVTVDAGPGSDFVSGGERDDTFNTRDGEADDVSCGDGADTVTADALDTVAPDCETVSTADPGPGGVAPATPSPPAAGGKGTAPGRQAGRARSLSCRLGRPRLRCRLRVEHAPRHARVTFTARRVTGGRASASATVTVTNGTAAATLRSRRRARPGVWVVEAVLRAHSGRAQVYGRVMVIR